jgi:hypothetical protein
MQLFFSSIFRSFCTGRETRTPDTWFWRPVLYQTELDPYKNPAHLKFPKNIGLDKVAGLNYYYFLIDLRISQLVK